MSKMLPPDLYGNRGQATCRRGKTQGGVKSRMANIAIDNKNSGITQEETGLALYGKIMDSRAIVISTRKNKYKVKEILRI
jgi:ATP phosphoribosyltransferase